MRPKLRIPGLIAPIQLHRRVLHTHTGMCINKTGVNGFPLKIENAGIRRNPDISSNGFDYTVPNHKCRP